MYFFTADEHHGHDNIRQYCDRPFKDTGEMSAEIIRRHNEVVGPKDTVIHAGDFAWGKHDITERYVMPLNGTHIFLKGSHDRWLPKNHPTMWEKKFNAIYNNTYIVVCHYAMRTWPRSHYGSWQLYGHSHGKLDDVGMQIDVGIDSHDFYPWSLHEIKGTMKAIHGAMR